MLVLSKLPFILLRLLTVFILYSGCRLLFYVYNQDLFAEMEFNELLNLFKGGLRFDLAAILYINALYLLLVLLPWPWRLEYRPVFSRLASLYFFIANALGVFVNLADTVYYPFSLDRSTIAVFDTFKGESNMLAVLQSAVLDFWPVTVSGLVMLMILWQVVKRTTLKPSPLPIWAFYPLHLAVIVPAILLSILGIRGGFGDHTRPLAMNHAGEYVTSANQMAIVLNTPFAAIRTLNKPVFDRKTYFNNTEQLNAIFDPKYKALQVADQPAVHSNVIILIMESFGSEQLGFFNSDLDNGTYRGLTPFLDSLMAKSLTFEYAFAHGRKSIDAIPAIVAGIPSMKVPYVISHYGTNEIQGLGSLLQEQGYQTAFFHGAPNGSMGFNAIMNLAGFTQYYGMDEFEQAEWFQGDYYDGTWGIWDEEFMQFMAMQLESLPQPFAASFFSLSSHHPNIIPDRYQGKFKPGDTIGNDTFQYADHALKLFFETASDQSWFEDTLFVIVADHATRTYRPEYKTAIGNQRIPIVFYKPDGSLTQQSSVVAQQADIFPTILDLLNIETDYLSFGHSLLDDNKPKFAVSFINSQYQLVQGDWMLQFSEDQATALYRYKDDPLLATNLINDQSERVLQQKKYMTRFIRAYIQQYNNRLIDDRLTVDSE